MSKIQDYDAVVARVKAGISSSYRIADILGMTRSRVQRYVNLAKKCGEIPMDSVVDDVYRPSGNDKTFSSGKVGAAYSASRRRR